MNPLYDGCSAYGVYLFKGKIYKVFDYQEHLFREAQGYASLKKGILHRYVSPHKIVGFMLDVVGPNENPPYPYALEIDHFSESNHWYSLGKMLESANRSTIQSALHKIGIEPGAFIHQLHKAGIADQEVTFFINSETQDLRMVDLPYNQTYANFGHANLDDLLALCE